MRILELKNKLGLFENPYKDADETKEKESFSAKSTAPCKRSRKKIVCPAEKRRENPAAWQGEKNCLGRTVCPQQKPDGRLVLYRRCKGCDKSGRGRKSAADTTNMSFHAGSPMLGSDIRLEGFGEAMEQSTTPEEEEAMLLEAVNAAKRGRCCRSCDR